MAGGPSGTASGIAAGLIAATATAAISATAITAAVAAVSAAPAAAVVAMTAAPAAVVVAMVTMMTMMTMVSMIIFVVVRPQQRTCSGGVKMVRRIISSAFVATAAASKPVSVAENPPYHKEPCYYHYRDNKAHANHSLRESVKLKQADCTIIIHTDIQHLSALDAECIRCRECRNGSVLAGLAD